MDGPFSGVSVKPAASAAPCRAAAAPAPAPAGTASTFTWQWLPPDLRNVMYRSNANSTSPCARRLLFPADTSVVVTTMGVEKSQAKSVALTTSVMESALQSTLDRHCIVTVRSPAQQQGETSQTAGARLGGEAGPKGG